MILHIASRLLRLFKRPVRHAKQTYIVGPKRKRLRVVLLKESQPALTPELHKPLAPLLLRQESYVLPVEERFQTRCHTAFSSDVVQHDIGDLSVEILNAYSSMPNSNSVVYCPRLMFTNSRKRKRTMTDVAIQGPTCISCICERVMKLCHEVVRQASV